ncbi:MAG: hypothetical protein ACETWM_07875 [Candidatus Lokiarchaeia archaeon]
MVESKISDFTMFEKAPYELPDPKVLTPLIMKALREVENTFGPVFTIRIIKYTLQRLSQKSGEEPPEDIKTLDQLAEYLISKSDKYPTCYSLLTYAQAKTENDLQGQIGAGTQVEMINVSRRIAESSSIEERNVDLDEIISNFRQTIVTGKLSPSEMGYKKNEDGSIDIIWPNCNFMEGCKLAHDEGLLKRPDGRQRCSSGSFMSQYFKLATGYIWDYDVLEAYKPNCITRCYMY